MKPGSKREQLFLASVVAAFVGVKGNNAEEDEVVGSVDKVVGSVDEVVGSRADV